MKLFAPKNNWDMKSSESWWPLVGSIQTSSGVGITEESALALTAFSCGVRCISETIASLPCHLLERKDERTTRKATDQPLYSIVHDQPNREQDAMLFYDCSLGWQVGWGDAYAEIERVGGKVVALWPIHPARLPVGNILRNGPRGTEIYVGEPGELVYWVKNDDGSETPIPASNMLHVPGVLSRNGITGRGLVKLGANALGISRATEDHAGAFFKNGANPNIAIKSPKIVGKETAERLRNQWQSTFGGVRNHYKTILLEDGMDAIPFTLSPEVSQLIASRQYGVVEVARLLRLPPYFLMDLTQGKYNNLEAQGQDLVIYSLMPWIVRWEKAMQRQLLTDAEKKKYKFKFNVMGLLRGDQQARAMFYQAGFNMGVLSPNDIRELEDLNPVEGGDQRFVPANNLVPLETIGKLAEANLEKLEAETERAKAPPPAPVAPAPQEDAEEDADAEMKAKFERLKAELLVQFEIRDAESLKRDEITKIFEEISKLPAAFGDQVRPLAELVRESVEHVDIAMAQAAEDREAVRQSLVQVPAAMSDAVGAVANAVDRLAESNAKIPVEVGKAVFEANTPLIEAQQAGFQAISEQNQEIRSEIKAIEFPPQPAPVPVDTSAAEALAVREADLERERAELVERLAAEREASHGVLVAALGVRLESLAEWESKALAKAVEKPKEFKSWRERFYLRFSKQFVASLGDFEPFASQIGVSLDLQADADRYSVASINDLKTLDEFANDNWHDRLKEGTDALRKNLWTGRAKALASEMVERGKQRFQEQNHA